MEYHNAFFKVILTFIVVMSLMFFGCQKPSDPSKDYMTYDKSEGTIGYGGGEIILNNPTSSINGALIIIPQGALNSDKEISISVDNSRKPQGSLTSDVIKIEPDGLSFNKPVTLKLPVENEFAEAPTLFYFLPDSNFVSQIPIKNLNNGFIEAEITHFSKYFVSDAQFAFFTASLYKPGNKIKAWIKFGGANGLASIPVSSWTLMKSVFMSGALVTNVKQAIDECTVWMDFGTREVPEAIYGTIKVDLKEGNWIGSSTLKSIKLSIQRKGKDIKKPTWVQVEMVKPESKILFVSNPLNSDQREKFFSGESLVFDFDTPVISGKKYFLEISWCLSDNPSGYWLASNRWTNVYEVTTYGTYPPFTDSDMPSIDLDANGDFVDDEIEKTTNGPLANFTADRTTINAGGSVQFTDQSTNNPTSWLWSFGDNTTSTSKNPSHTYTTSGTYSVSLTATNFYGSDTKTIANFITVNPSGSAPMANFTSDHTTITANGIIQFTDQSTNNPTSWLWNFGDNTTSTSRNTSHTYSTAGTYSVSLTATNSYGSNTKTLTNFITVNPTQSTAPVANFTVNNTTITVGSAVQFIDQSSNNPTIWSWNFGDGYTSTDINPNHIYSSQGVFSVSLTVSNAFGSNSKTISNYITVNQNPSDNGIIFNPNLTYGTVTDVDGNAYKTIQIETQTWMAENLKTTRYNDRTDIPNVIDASVWNVLTTPGYCWYDNDLNNKEPYGALYNWYAINTGKLCPSGWHIPSNDEVSILSNSLGGDGVSGVKLRETGFNHWANQHPIEGTNESGFTALPGGYRSPTYAFFQIHGEGLYWTSTPRSPDASYILQMLWYETQLRRPSYYNYVGISVRCLKDN